MSDRNETKQQIVDGLADMCQQMLESGEFGSILSSSCDSNNRKKMKETLRSSENHYRTIFESTGTAMVIVDEDMTIIMANAELENITGYSREEIECKKWTEFIPPDDQSWMSEYYKLRKTDPDKAPEGYEFRFIDKRGNEKCAYINVAVIPETTKIVASFIDITEKKCMEEALRESEEKYRLLVENVQHMIFVVQDEMFKFVNPFMIEVTGYSADELMNKSFINFIHPDDQSLIMENHLKSLQGEIFPSVYSFRMLDREDHIRWMEINTVLFTWKGKPAILGFAHDITDRKRAEEELKFEKAYLERLFERSPEAIVLVDNESNFIHLNNEFSRLFGYALDEVSGQCLDDLLVPDYLHNEGVAITQKIAKGNRIAHETVRQRKDGTLVDVSILGTPIEIEEGQIGVYAIYRDITDQKRAERALKESEEKYRTILETIEEGYYEVDIAGRFIFVNDSTCNILGYPRQELMGMNNREYTTPEASKRIYGIYNQIYRTGKPAKNVDFEIIRKDGTVRFVALSASLIRNQENEPIGFRGVVRDVTDHKLNELEREKLEAQLRQAQKMESIGTLAGGIAHNFNNLLMGIQGNASLMLLDSDSDHPYKGKLKNIEKLVQSGSRLTSQLLGFAREGKYEVTPISLNKLVKDTSETFDMTRREIRIRREFDDNTYEIMADQGQIEQCLMNLFVNAADAMPRGGDLILKTTNVTHKDMKGRPYKPKPGKYVLLTVTDTGAGIDREIQDRIFEPFFTSKGLGKGTGLGLASAYGIIKSHGGYIDVFSEKDRGTTFKIYLPASEKKSKRGKEKPERLARGNETILIVDDEPMVLEIGQEMLKMLGFKVLTAHSGNDAITICRTNKSKIDLVVLDMIMPGMDGGETYDILKKMNSELKVLLSSGYSIDGRATEILDRGCDGFIQKPFSAEQISSRIREILGN
ncbi:MAG: PAS domain S-box protein [Deltaproteobacteria bacterium]|nr:PAS domain S-box protein [Deltaproteobacteria bacterium]